MTTNQNSIPYIFIGIIICVFIFLFSVKLVLSLNGFIEELKYLNSEIDRTDGNERKFWIQQRKKLWLSLILFFKY